MLREINIPDFISAYYWQSGKFNIFQYFEMPVNSDQIFSRGRKATITKFIIIRVDLN
jgi:hypothetical protein